MGGGVGSEKERWNLVLILLSVAMLLVGGGFGPLLIGILAGDEFPLYNFSSCLNNLKSITYDIENKRGLAI